MRLNYRDGRIITKKGEKQFEKKNDSDHLAMIDHNSKKSTRMARFTSLQLKSN